MRLARDKSGESPQPRAIAIEAAKWRLSEPGATPGTAPMRGRPSRGRVRRVRCWDVMSWFERLGATSGS